MVELTWQGKYDADGKRTAPLRVQLPFQLLPHSVAAGAGFRFVTSTLNAAPLCRGRYQQAQHVRRTTLGTLNGKVQVALQGLNCHIQHLFGSDSWYIFIFKPGHDLLLESHFTEIIPHWAFLWLYALFS